MLLPSPLPELLLLLRHRGLGGVAGGSGDREVVRETTRLLRGGRALGVEGALDLLQRGADGLRLAHLTWRQRIERTATSRCCVEAVSWIFMADSAPSDWPSSLWRANSRVAAYPVRRRKKPNSL